MDEQKVYEQLITLNDSEIFYRNYRLAKASPASFAEYLANIDLSFVHQNNLLVPELAETIPPEYLENWYFTDETTGIHVCKHNCYTPAIPHKHNFFEMFFVLEGRCLHQVGENNSVLHAGDLCLIQPHVTHSIDVSDESIIIDVLIRKSTFRQYFYNLLQSDSLISSFFMSTLYARGGMDYLIFHTAPDQDIHFAFLDMCAEAMDCQIHYQAMINAMLTHILILLLRRHTSTCEVPSSSADQMEQAMQFISYIQSHSRDITLEQVATHFHYTSEYTSRIIRQVTGQTYMQLLTSIRIENAKRLLRDTAMSTVEVGSAVGYETPEHFMRTFKKHVHCSPSEYRQK